MFFSFLRDRDFARSMLAIALPVAFQQLITASLNMIDVLMVTHLGETSVAALGLANQIFFLLILFLFGVTSGMAIWVSIICSIVVMVSPGGACPVIWIWGGDGGLTATIIPRAAPGCQPDR